MTLVAHQENDLSTTRFDFELLQIEEQLRDIETYVQVYVLSEA